PVLRENIQEKQGDWLLLISKTSWGESHGKLGPLLLESFFQSLVSLEIPPAAIFFFNEGVLLGTDRSSVIFQSLLRLERQGIELGFCGASLDYFQLKRELYIGKMISVNTIAERISRCSRVVSL
ncbi:MAG: hypothetical protein RR396_04480, partial [Clostridiales bacterium]